LAYLIVRLLHLLLYVLAGKRDPDLLEAVLFLACAVGAACGIAWTETRVGSLDARFQVYVP
jgi:hypothetical protein